MATSIGFNVFARDKASGVFARISHSVSGLGKTAALALGGVAVGGVAALGAAMVQGVKDAEAYQQLGFKTAAVLKSTGNAAHQSVAGIQARAAALESMSGVDETLIINSQNVLATFTKVQDKIGKGNNIFTQGTTAALNLSTALGTDLQGATIQVGKALNDPIKGITALRRVGVSFTKSQIDQVKAMVDSGNTMGAQKLILAELNKEFGGAAKAAGQGFAGSMARAKDAVGDAFRSIGTQLLPSLTRMADFIAANAGPAIAKLGAWMTTTLIPALQKAAAAIQKFISNFANGVGTAGQLRTVLVLLGAAFLAVAGFIGRNLDVIVPLVGIAITAIGAFRLVTAAVWLWGKAQLFLNGTLTANPIGLVIVALALIAVALVIAWKRSEKFRDTVKLAFASIQVAALYMAVICVTAFRHLVGIFLTAASTIVHGAALAFGWVPVLGPKLKAADRAVSSFKTNVNASLAKIQRNLEIKLATARAAEAAAALKRRMDAIRSKNVRINVLIAASVSNRWALEFANRQHGGPVRKGHPYIVGERGPELVIPKVDGTVISAKDSARIMSAGTTGREAAINGGTSNGQVLQPIIIQMDTGVVWRGLIKYGRELGFQIVPA